MDNNTRITRVSHQLTTRTANRMNRMIAFTQRIISLGALSLLISQTAFAKDMPGTAETSWGVGQGGGFQFQIPVVVPNGLNGIQPNLALSYSSGGGNGSLGVGWGLSGLGAITRCGQTYATNSKRTGVQHNADDRFCLNGKQLILTSGSYGVGGSEYRTEVEGFSKIEAVGTNTSNINGGNAPNYFIVWRKDGRKHYYGFDANSQVKLAGTSSIGAWKLSRVYDRNDNYYQVTYNATDYLPESIDYTIGSGLAARLKVDFIYEVRPDIRTSYRLGTSTVHDRRMSRINITNNLVTAREYNLAYETGTTVSGRSRIKSIEQCGQNGTCAPLIPTAYHADTAGYSNSTASDDVAQYDMIEYHTYQAWVGGVQESRVKEINNGNWVDLNGDGRVDQLIAVTKPNGSVVHRAYLKNADGTWSGNQSAWHLPRTLRNYDDSITNMSTGRFASNVINQGQLIDVNGDGLPDLVYAYEYITTVQQYATDPKVTVKETYLNTGTGWEATPNAAWAPKDLLYEYVSNASGNVRGETVRGRLIDLDGDGLVDWVRAYHDYISYDGGLNGVHYKTTWMNTGNGWGSANSAYEMPDVFVEYKAMNRIQHGEFVDVNGDGLVDWVQSFHRWDPAPTDNRNTWLNTGTGWAASPNPDYKMPEVIHTMEHGGWSDRSPTRRGTFVDVNGDGLRDWVRSYKAGSTTDYRGTLINTGKGWVANANYQTPFIHMDHTYSSYTRNWPVNIQGVYQDLNGDGLVDYASSYKTSDTGFQTYQQAWLNTGSGWSEQFGSPYVPTDLYFDYSGRENAKSNFGSLIDINNDGAADWVKSRAGITPSTSLGQLDTPDQIELIATTLGVEVIPTFERLTDNDTIYTKGTGAPEAAARHYAAPMLVTANLKTSSADGSGWNTTTYEYGGAQVHRLGLGAITYVNNAFGDLVSQTDAKTQTISMEYDALGRMTERTVPGIASASGGISTFVFDTAANGIGLPASTTGPNGYSKTFTYDSYSRPISDTTTIKGKAFTQSYTYNSAGQLASRSYPESGTGKPFGVQYQYLNGYLQVIKSLADANGDCIEHWRAEQYDALGRTQSDTLGKIVTTTRGFKDGQGVLETIQSVMLVNSGGNVQNLTYTYDENNNVKTRDDLYGAGKETFLYDDLDRLTDYSQAAGSPHAMADPVEVQYNAIGNIEYKSDVGTYSYGQNGAGPHAVTSVALADPLQNVLNLNLAHFAVNLEWEGATIPAPQASIHGSVFTYDANGSVEVSGNRQVHWTAFDKPSHMLLIAADGTERGSTIEYGPSFERVYKQEGEFAVIGGAPIAINETTLYVGKDYEHITDKNGATKHRYTIAAGGHSIQIEREDGSSQDEPKYLLGDNLGSTNVILDAAGNVSQRLNFDPWGMRTKNGDVAAVNEITNKGYTGHEMDDETGLVNMNARIYDPYLGRFLSADPVLPDAKDMQAFNRYSYVSNNPMAHIDPTGNLQVDVSVSFDYEIIGEYQGGSFVIGSRVDHQAGIIISGFIGSAITIGDGGIAVDNSGFDPTQGIFIDVDINITIIWDFTLGAEADEDGEVQISIGVGTSLGANSSSGEQDDPSVSCEPLHCLWVEFLASIETAKQLGRDGDVNGYIDRVKTNGVWDYKNRDAYKDIKGIEEFGNFAFGATGAAFADGATRGVSNSSPLLVIQLLHRGAGFYQQYFQNYDPSFGTFLDPFGGPGSAGNFGDELKDHIFIEAGAEYYFRVHG